MKLKVVNTKKFIRSSIVVIGIILFLLFIGVNSTYSKGEVKYKKQYITNGDTLWEIAQKEANENKYFENVDVRSIVKEIKDLNNIQNQTLKVGQKIQIPTY